MTLEEDLQNGIVEINFYINKEEELIYQIKNSNIQDIFDEYSESYWSHEKLSQIELEVYCFTEEGDELAPDFYSLNDRLHDLRAPEGFKITSRLGDNPGNYSGIKSNLKTDDLGLLTRDQLNELTDEEITEHYHKIGDKYYPR
jgi:hypothetical protein